MPVPKIQSEDFAAMNEGPNSASRPDHLHADLENCAPVEAEPHRLQGEIASRWGEVAPVDERWTLRQTAAFCLVSCGAFWAVSIYGVLHILG